MAIKATKFSSTDFPLFIFVKFNFFKSEKYLLFNSLNSLTKIIKSSFFATKSVSQFTSIIDVFLLSPDTITTPSLALLDIFFEALTIPLTLKISTALSKSPFDSLSDALQSLKPAPVDCLSFFIFSISLML